MTTFLALTGSVELCAAASIFILIGRLRRWSRELNVWNDRIAARWRQLTFPEMSARHVEGLAELATVNAAASGDVRLYGRVLADRLRLICGEPDGMLAVLLYEVCRFDEGTMQAVVDNPHTTNHVRHLNPRDHLGAIITAAAVELSTLDRELTS